MIAAIALVVALVACAGIAGVVGYLRWNYRESRKAGELVTSMFNALTLPAWPARPRPSGRRKR